MNVTDSINMQEYTYVLPDERIAAFPTPNREASRLLVSDKNIITDATFSSIHTFIPKGSLLVFNETKVVQARLHFAKENGTPIEIFCLEPAPDEGDVATAYARTGSVTWTCFIGGSRKWKNGTLTLHKNEITLSAEKLSLYNNTFICRFSWNNEMSFAAILDTFGHVPLPPYIKRAAELTDKTRYQTVFAHNAGSVAAPTAGLHFTEQLIKETELKTSSASAYITLHVGAGTFKPVSGDLQSHVMHTEQFSIDIDTIRKIRHQINTGAVVAIGTTTVRTLESLYWVGVNIRTNHPEPFHIGQWQPYSEHTTLTSTEALDAIIDYLTISELSHFSGSTCVIIVPGYTFKIVTDIITNFHQPGSTLLLLVAAFAGNTWKDVYAHALIKDYRFLSYGDACFFRKTHL